MPYIKITQDMFNNIEYDRAVIGQSEKLTGKMANASECTPTVLIVADKGDLNAAAYHLARSLQYPFAPEVIVTVLVAESTRPAFLERLQALLKPIPADVSQHAERNKILALIAKHNWETISIPEFGANSPVIVCDVTHEHLGNGYNGVVTLHTFRTIQESISLCVKESIKPVNASIWSSNHASAYEIGLKIPCINIFIDCYQVSLEPLKTTNATTGTGTCALVEQNYHYETLKLQNGAKNVVFPIGTAIAN
ncbi:PREDICTED: uncharacterized protein LOC108375014 isoform X2 [Rhagoletis zephyria]|uniref:uncharacterized protein LOC108375014 isoform X1 n=1 Tax=Rhagoletis zephyria TaxID=28612 RepID=UPI00081195EC|nr:PREDICTED: uncharacterized protein LOC108375014 isoform X1 [Rhagoletis zephyria]XP_017486574.1 PREDICTED: uncharacterized protein LOC108375014 isoform X2 [Rhagoletis zephyria]